MPKVVRPLTVLFAVAAAAAVFGVGTAQASRCSAALIHDWYVDGRIDNTYQVHCYQEALRDIPEDQIVYGTLRDDLTRALQSAIRKNGGHIDLNASVPGGGPGGGNGPSSGSKTGFFHWVARELGPSTADSIPVP